MEKAKTAAKTPDVVKRKFVCTLIEQRDIDNVAFAGLLASEHGSTV